MKQFQINNYIIKYNKFLVRRQFMNKVILCGNLTKDMDVKIIKGKTKKIMM